MSQADQPVGSDVSRSHTPPKRPLSLGAGAVVVHDERVLLVRNKYGVTQGRYLLPAGRVNVGVAVGCAVGVGAGVLVGATVAVGGFDGVGVVGEIGPGPFLPTSNATLPPTSVTATSPAIDMTKVRRDIFLRRAGTFAGMAWADKGAAAIVGKGAGVGCGKGAANASLSVLPALNGLGVR